MIKKTAARFFKWYCNPEYYEDIKGDLNELFHRQLEQKSPHRAEWYFAIQVLLLFRPSIIRPFHFWDLNYIAEMIKNYLTIGARNLRKHPMYSLLHIMGLAIGLAAFLFIHHYRKFEKSYDDFHYQANQLYRLTTDDVLNGRIQVRDAMSFAPSGKALQDELPEVLSYTTTAKPGRLIIRKDQETVQEENIVAADSSFLSLFRYEIISGDKRNMLTEPYSIVLTESQARKYFGQSDPVGQSLEVLGDFNRPFKVTGLIRDVPLNTHYHFELLVSLQSYRENLERDAWNGYNYYTYLLIDQRADMEKLRAQMPALSRKYLGDVDRLEFNLQPVRDIHLYSDFTYEPQIHGSAKAVNFLGIISVFILLIAWVNYINLSTARAVERAKEVALRKVVGAQKGQLIGQFLTESLLINFAGAIIALILAIVTAPYLNAMVGKPIFVNILEQSAFLRDLVIFFLVGSVITGVYPAILLSSFKPIGVLKGAFGRSRQGTILRKALVVVQFTVSLILIAGTLIVYLQIKYMTQKDLGINTDQVISFLNARGSESYDQFLTKYTSFTQELERLPGVKGVGGLSDPPGGGSSEISSSSGGIQVVGKTDIAKTTVYLNRMNDRLINTLELDLISGRNFNRDFESDTSAVILNQSLLNTLGVEDPSSILNEYIQFGTDPSNSKHLVVGVIKDYNRSSLKNTIEPTVFFHGETPRCTVAKLDKDNISANIAEVQGVWNQFFPNAPFTYEFLDQRFEKLYLEDRKFGLIFFNFAILAILLASIGLFGLSSYLSIQRTKEVGVRKILGASVNNIVLLFFRDFLWLISIAVLIGVPLIYLGMDDWLNGYAFRINFPWLWLLIAVIGVLMLTFFTVSYQTWRLARLNPAQTIRYE